MKSGAIVMNLARGGIIEETALLAGARERASSRGAIVDAFTKEPLAADHPLRKRAEHASHAAPRRVDARRRSATWRSTRARRCATRCCTASSRARSTWPAPAPATGRSCSTRCTSCARAAIVARAILADRGVQAVQRLSLRVGPELAGAAPALLASAAAGVLEGTIDVERLNLINARSIAEARGIELSMHGVRRARASGGDARERERRRAADGGGRGRAGGRAGATDPHRRLPRRRRAARDADHPHEQRRARRDRARRHAARRSRREHRRVSPGAARAGWRGARGDQRGRHGAAPACARSCSSCRTCARRRSCTSAARDDGHARREHRARRGRAPRVLGGRVGARAWCPRASRVRRRRTRWRRCSPRRARTGRR